MKRFLTSVLVALTTFVILNFFYSNVGGEAFNFPLSFRFDVPYVFVLKSAPIPLGFIIIASFCIGMIFLPLLQLIPWMLRSRQIRERDRKIRDLEQELSLRSETPVAIRGEGSSS